jgi:hypothetical protein
VKRAENLSLGPEAVGNLTMSLSCAQLMVVEVVGIGLSKAGKAMEVDTHW